MSIRTPWGNAQTTHVHAEDIVFYSTASHGGFKLDRERNALVHSAWRNRGGWRTRRAGGRRPQR